MDGIKSTDWGGIHLYLGRTVTAELQLYSVDAGEMDGSCRASLSAAVTAVRFTSGTWYMRIHQYRYIRIICIQCIVWPDTLCWNPGWKHLEFKSMDHICSTMINVYSIFYVSDNVGCHLIQIDGSLLKIPKGFCMTFNKLLVQVCLETHKGQP